MKHRSIHPGLKCLIIAMLCGALACGRKTDAPSSPGVAETAVPQSTANSVEVLFVYGSEKQSWIDDITPRFNASKAGTSAGKTIVVKAVAMGSGESKDDILAGRLKAHVWSPASGLFIRLGNAESMAKGQPLVGPTRDLVLSPIVIAMWKPMAEALGWPLKPIGWSDVLTLAKSAKGWGDFGHPEFGAFKFGHTHPEYSNSGLASILIELYAATGKVRGLDLEDLRKPQTAKYLSEIEQSIVHYGRSTGFFGKRLYEDGPAYLSAAVMYENMVIESYTRPRNPPLVSIYPKEGTIWSDHPVGIVNRAWVDEEHKEAAEKYISFLRAPEQQKRALAFGFRPAEGALGAPIDAAHGVDPAQPATIIDLPGADVINASIELWRTKKKHSTIALVFDKSGSMNDEHKIDSAKQGAIELVNQLGPEDRLVFLPFSTNVTHIDLGAMDQNRQKAIDTVSRVIADGGTNLFSAILDARALLMKSADPSRINAIVVLTDGEDNGKDVTLSQLLKQINADQETGGMRIFTIGYGGGAQLDDLKRIAKESRGEFYKGDPENIRKVFRDIATFF